MDSGAGQTPNAELGRHASQYRKGGPSELVLLASAVRELLDTALPLPAVHQLRHHTSPTCDCYMIERSSSETNTEILEFCTDSGIILEVYPFSNDAEPLS